jgi:signal peptide peptidase SppA
VTTHLSTLLGGSVWALEPSVLNSMREVIDRHLQGMKLPAEEIQAIVEAASNRRRQHASQRRDIQGVAVIPIHGVISRRSSLVSSISQPSGTSIDQLEPMLQEAMDDPNIRAIMLDVDSPGGSVQGIQEFADQIQEARSHKPVVAHVDGMCASAAYWLASQADSIVATRGSQVGGIGVYATVEDSHRQQEAEGVDVHIIRSQRLKGAGSPGTKLDADAQGAIQEQVDAYAELFAESLSRSRASLDADAISRLDGRVLLAANAVEHNLIDGVGNFNDTVRSVATSNNGEHEDQPKQVNRFLNPTSPQDTAEPGLESTPDQLPAEDSAPQEDEKLAPIHEPRFVNKPGGQPQQLQREPNAPVTPDAPSQHKAVPRLVKAEPNQSRPEHSEPRNPGPHFRKSAIMDLLTLQAEHPGVFAEVVADAGNAERLRASRILKAATSSQFNLASSMVTDGTDLDEALTRLSSDPRRNAHATLQDRMDSSPDANDVEAPPPEQADPEVEAFEKDPAKGQFDNIDQWRTYRAAIEKGLVRATGGTVL